MMVFDLVEMGFQALVRKRLKSRLRLTRMFNKIVERMNKPWMVVGDFNDIASITRRKKGAQVSIKKCNVFRNRINGCNLIAIRTIGPKYTWR